MVVHEEVDSDLELSSQYLNTEMLTVALAGSNEDAERTQDPKHDYVHYDHIKGFGESAERTKNIPQRSPLGVILMHSIISPPLKF